MVMPDMPTRYDPKESEDKWYRCWEENNLFSAKPSPDKKPFCIVIPPPNVTGILHMGHALNNAVQDILVRYHRMKGDDSLWIPGTDHAGIATQNVVEKQIAKESLKRQDLGREKFIERIWQWREQYGSTIIRQLKKIGASCDWSRLRFTMDEEYSQSVRSAFIALWEKGLIYQGDKVINWCPRCQTALSDEEAPYHALKGNLYYIRYPLKQSSEKAETVGRRPSAVGYVIVATTRPETILGDTAVAVNPKDKRYKNLIGETLILPLAGREIKIIADSMVDMKFGTGAVKVTPAHDPNDYLLGKKHNLEFINIMHPDGRLNDKTGKYDSMDRFEAREAILEDLKEKGLFDKAEPHELSAGHCYRCHTIIEPYLSRQWFVRMKPLAGPAIEAVKKGRIKFHPERWTKVYLNWMENIQDWCISRQIWWGHRLPIYYCKNCLGQTNESAADNQQSAEKSKSADLGLTGPADHAGIIVSCSRPDKCPACGSGDIYQDEDVLDTWFSSWLWPFAVFGWPFEPAGLRDGELKNDLSYFYPTSVLVTAPEIIFFWVARMIMAGLEFTKVIPFKDVYIHGTVRDAEGKKMSKSLGNIIDPLDIISEYGADALRFSLISITAQGQDVFLSKERFEQGRNFANKIWNASRFILMNLEAQNTRVDLCEFSMKKDLDIVNRWILSRFYSVLKEMDENLAAYKLNEAANLLYGFFWHEFCDWYLESVKPILSNRAQNTEYRHTQAVMYNVLEKFLRILHPFMPFITEEIWQRIGGGASIMSAPWPRLQKQVIDKKAEKQMGSLIKIIRKIRDMRNYIDIEPDAKEVNVSCYPYNKKIERLIEENTSLIRDMSKAFSFTLVSEDKKPPAAAHSVIEGAHLFLHFTGVFNIEKIKIKKEAEINSLQRGIDSKKALLENKNFVNKAPKEIVEKEKENKSKMEAEVSELKKIFNDLFY